MAAGKLRHVGVSNFDADQIEEFSRTLQVETLQPPYHLFRRDIEASILPYTRAHDIGVLVYGTLAHGLLSGAMAAETHFAPQDWRSRSDAFRGEPYRRNLRILEALKRFAEFELGTTVSSVAIVAFVDAPVTGTREPARTGQLTILASGPAGGGPGARRADHAPHRRDRPRRGPRRWTQPGVSVGRFIYRFVVGGDWMVAVVMVVALVATAAMVADGLNAWWLVPPLAVLMTGVSLSRRGAGFGHAK